MTRIVHSEPVEDLSTYLNRVKTLRQRWEKKRFNWDGEQITRRGEEEALWFRGQPAIAPLSPKLYRKEYAGADEAEIRHQFQSRATQLMQGRVPEPERKWDWYFIMQHYGAPTRLLDWTDNPLVGLFFAVTDEWNKDDAAVWVLDPSWLNHKLFKQVSGSILPDWQEAQVYLKKLEDAFTVTEQVRKARPAAIDPPHVDRRLAVQGSHFTIFGKSKDLTKSKLVKDKGCRLAKIPILKERILEIKAELEDCGVTPSFVFPDLEALGKELDAYWKKRR